MPELDRKLTDDVPNPKYIVTLLLAYIPLGSDTHIVSIPLLYDSIQAGNIAEF